MTASCQSARPVPDSKPVAHRGRQNGSGRTTLYLLLAIVAGAAAMLSFAALRDLAELCGFARVLAWLLPVVIDAGAAAGSLVWLSEHTGTHARVFAGGSRSACSPCRSRRTLLGTAWPPTRWPRRGGWSW